MLVMSRIRHAALSLTRCRRVQADCAIAVDGNSYSVPWRLIGESVQVMVCSGARHDQFDLPITWFAP